MAQHFPLGLMSHADAVQASLDRMMREQHAAGRHGMCPTDGACKRGRRIGGWLARRQDPEGLPPDAHGAHAYIR